VERLVTALETLFDERKQKPALLLGVVKERADMTPEGRWIDVIRYLSQKRRA